MPPNEYDKKLSTVLWLLMDDVGVPVITAAQLREAFQLHLKAAENPPEYAIELAWVRRQLDSVRADTILKVAAKDRLFLMTNLIRHRTKDVWQVPEILVGRRLK